MNITRSLLLLAPLTFLVPVTRAQDDPISRAQDAIEAADANIEAGNEIITVEARDEAGTEDVVFVETEEEQAPMRDDGTFSINYEATPIRTVLRNVAEAADLNVVIPDDLVGNVTLKLRGVTWPQIFDTVLQGTGFVWQEESRGIIRIARVGAEEMVEVRPDGTLNVTFTNQPLRSAVQAVGETVELNIVLPPDLEGTTSANLRGVSWQRVLDTILQENGYQWIDDEGIIRVQGYDSRIIRDPGTGYFNVNVSGEPLSSLMSLVSDRTSPRMNFNIPPSIQDRPITLSLVGVDIDALLAAIEFQISSDVLRGAAAAGEDAAPPPIYRWFDQSPNTKALATEEYIASLGRQPPITRVFALRFAEASRILNTLMPYNENVDPDSQNDFRKVSDEISSVIDGVESIRADVANNTLITRAKPSAMPELATLISDLDQPLAQVLIESKFVEVFNVDAYDIGIDWTSVSGLSIGTGSEGINRTWSRTRSSENESVRTVLDEVSSSQSTVDSRNSGSNSSSFNERNIGTGSETERLTDSDGNITGFVQIPENTDLTRSGNLSSRSSSREVDSTSTTGSNFTDSVLDTFTNIAATSRIDSAIFGVDQFRLVLNFLETYTDSKILTNPNLVVLNGSLGIISLGDYLYKPGDLERTDSGVTRGSPVPLDVQPVTKLTVRPTLVGNELIAMRIKPEVNNEVGQQNFDGDEIPTIRERTTESTVILRSGNTLAIGGLMEEQENLVTSKVPILGDIPLLGRLFSNESMENRLTNQIIFITASVLNPQTATYLDVVGARNMNRMNLTAQDAMGVGADPLSAREKALEEEIRVLRNRIEERKQVDELEQNLEGLGEGAYEIDPDEEETPVETSAVAPPPVEPARTLPARPAFGPRNR